MQNTKLRALTPAELELVAGGNSITVTGERWDPWADRWWYDQMFEDHYHDDYGGGGGGGEPPPPADSDSNDVTNNITRPLTAVEQQAVADLNAKIAAVTNVINAIPDNAAITLSDGTTVTGAELKAIWAATDFVINEVGHTYANGTTLGEANYNGGDPVVSYNIDTLVNYNAHNGGMEFLILHEIGHMTANSRAHNALINSDGTVTAAEMDDHQRLANDIARAIANQGGLTIMSNPGSGYSPTTPTFQTPSGGGSGGGGEAYYAYDLPFQYVNYYWNYYQIP